MTGTIERYETRAGIRWRYRYTKPGMPRRQGAKRGYTSRREAQAGLRAQLAALDAGAQPSTQTLAEYQGQWQPAVGPRTAHECRQTARTYLRPALGSVRLRDLRPEHVEQLHSLLASRGLSSKTQANVHGVLRSALRDAQRRDLVVANAAASIPAPRGCSAAMQC